MLEKGDPALLPRHVRTEQAWGLYYEVEHGLGVQMTCTQIPSPISQWDSVLKALAQCLGYGRCLVQFYFALLLL